LTRKPSLALNLISCWFVPPRDPSLGMPLPPNPLTQPLRYSVGKLFVLTVEAVVCVQNDMGYIRVAGRASNTAQIFAFLCGNDLIFTGAYKQQGYRHLSDVLIDPCATASGPASALGSASNRSHRRRMVSGRQ